MKKILTALIVFTICSFASAQEQCWEVFFTDPSGKVKSGNTPENGLLREIRNTVSTFYGAFYDISSKEIAIELVNAGKRGVDVKLVTDDANFEGECITMLLDAGIPVVNDGRPGLMHNKFAVIDGEIIFTGSFNTTDNCAHLNNNNAVLFRSRELAAIYLGEFDEMFNQGIFGNRKEKGPFSAMTKSYYADVDGIDVNVYFAPEDNVERIIYNRIKKARVSVYFMCFSFTSDDLGELLIEKHKSGVRVAGIFEKNGSGSEYSEYTKMKIEGVPVELDTNRNNMHHKVLIIDGVRVITGSYNLSRNADMRNDENIIIIDSREIAARFMEEFNRLYPGGAKWE